MFESLQNNSQMTCTLFLTLRVNEYIINKDNNKTNKSKYCLNTLFIKYMKAAGTLVSPNDITTIS